MLDKIDTYINEQEVSEVSDAAVLAEKSVLTHRDTFDKLHSSSERSVTVPKPFVLPTKPGTDVEGMISGKDGVWGKG